MNMGKKIVQLRKENKLTQDELAARLFVTRQAVSKWERGLSFPSVDVLRLISKEFHVGMDDLLDLHEREKARITSRLVSSIPAMPLSMVCHFSLSSARSALSISPV